jgi:hypothetical protein
MIFGMDLRSARHRVAVVRQAQKELGVGFSLLGGRWRGRKAYVWRNALIDALHDGSLKVANHTSSKLAILEEAIPQIGKGQVASNP